jgi:hypothetical protein
MCLHLLSRDLHCGVTLGEIMRSASLIILLSMFAISISSAKATDGREMLDACSAFESTRDEPVAGMSSTKKIEIVSKAGVCFGYVRALMDTYKCPIQKTGAVVLSYLKFLRENSELLNLDADFLFRQAAARLYGC